MPAPAELKAKIDGKEQEPEPPCYADAILDVDRFLSLSVPEKEVYLHPWLTAQSIFMVSAWRGAGKTLWILGILDAVTKGMLSPKKNGPRYERLGGSGELIFSVIPAAVFEPLAAHCVIG